jgi:probable HAF family extracellular repeat protein
VLNAVGGSGTLAGTHFNNTGSQSDAVQIAQGTTTTLGTLGGASGEALGVNSRGDVVGASQRAGDGQNQATLWLGQTAIDLGVTGANGSAAIGINDAGQIVGSVTDESWMTTALKWDNGVLMRLEDLGSGFASPSDINSGGLVVGSSETTSFASHAVMWDGTHIIDLNSLLTDEQRAAGWELLGAAAINDSGVIIGNALKNNVPMSFVLTPTPVPVPEPSRYAMTLTGLVLLGGLFWRRKTLTK